MPAALTIAGVLGRAAWRGWRARPFLAALNVLGLAIGIGVYLAIRIVNHSASRSFQAGIDLVAGRSDLEIISTGGVAETVWPELQTLPGIRAATPVVEGYATLPDHPGEYLRIIGMDPFTAGPFFETVDGGGASAAWRNGTESWLTGGKAVWISSGLAGTLDLKADSALRLALPGGVVPVRIAAVFPDPPDQSGPLRTAFLDIGWAQELLGTAGTLSSIQIIADQSDKADILAARIRPLLPPDIQVEPPAQRNRQVSLMLRGFQLNLTALSMVSLLVGVFLIGNTVSASVVRQRREIGVLRAIGASRTQVRTVFLGEAAFSALLGGLLGIPLARVLAAQLLDGVSQTISAHYVLLSIDKLWVSPAHIAQALGCGLIAALVGAWLPAREASAVDPVAVLRPGRSLPPRQVPWWRPLGPVVVLGGLAGWLSWQSLHSGPAWLSFGACLCLVLSFVMLARPAAAAAAGLAELVLRPFPSLMPARMGAAQLARALHRAIPVIAALLTSVAMVLGVTIMIHSFRGTLAVWVDSSLKADLYIAPAANEVIRRSATLPDTLVQHLREDAAVQFTETLYEDRVRLPDGNAYTLRAIQRDAARPLAWMGPDTGAAEAHWRQPDHLAASEILANRLHLKPGQILTLPTPAGPQAFTVSGIFTDYSDDQGCLSLTRENYTRHWPESGDHAAAVYLKDPSPAAAAALESTLRETFRSAAPLVIYRNQALRTRVFEIFDQTFAVTGLLRVIAIAVAVLGITLALGTLVAERAWDIAALRSIGAGRGQVALLHLTEAGLIGLVSAILGMGSGLLLSMILTWVVNKAFFGWTVRYAVPWGEWAATPAWVIPVALLAGLLPAWQAAKASPATALRSE